MIPNAAAGGTAVPFKIPTVSISQPATISSILERSASTIARTADREKNFHNGPSAGSEQSDKNVGAITYFFLTSQHLLLGQGY
jgi:hypothetical protein